jgi:hypothetical protein
MKKAIMVLSACLAAAGLGAIDLGAGFVMTNFGFPWSRTEPIADPTRPSPLSFLYGGGAFAEQALSESLSVRTAYDLDPLSRSWLSAGVTYSTGIIQVGLGSQFGLFNNLARPLTAGLSSSIKLEIPGLVFASVENSSSLGQAMGAVGDNSQERNDIRVGWYVRNAICSAIFSTDKYQERRSADLVTTDTMVDYIFLVDIFKKNQPYNILLSLGYKTTSREYSGATSVKDSLGMVLLGTGLRLRPIPALEIDLELESGVYTFGFDNLLGHGPLQTDYYFKALTGITVKTSEFRARGQNLPAYEKLENINVEESIQPAEEAPEDAPIEDGAEAAE